MNAQCCQLNKIIRKNFHRNLTIQSIELFLCYNKNVSESNLLYIIIKTINMV